MTGRPIDVLTDQWALSTGNFCVLYAARRLSDRLVKVGCSMNPYRRIQTLAREHGDLDWLGWWPAKDALDGYEEERELHRLFHGDDPGKASEWYSEPLPPELVSWLARLAPVPQRYAKRFVQRRRKSVAA